MTYVDSDGEKKYPTVIHRTSIGCYERTLALLIEKHAGAMPLWLAPVQVVVAPITERTHDYAQSVAKKLSDAGFRTETDSRNEKIGYKIREAQLQKVPYMIVLGDKEAESGLITVRSRAQGDIGTMELSAFIEKLVSEQKAYK